MNSKHNEGKSVVAKGFIRTLKNKISKYMTSVLKNVYIDKLDDIVNKYNNTYRNTIKMKPHILTLVKNLMIKILNLKLVKLLEYKNTKTFLLKVTLQIGLKKFLWLKMLKILLRGYLLLMISTVKTWLELFTKINCKKQIKKNLELKK